MVMMPLGVFRNPLRPENLAKLLRPGNVNFLPTNAAWTETKVATGDCTASLGDYYLVTGATANSSALIAGKATGFGSATWYKTEWDKKLYLVFNVARALSDTEVVARVKYSEDTAVGALATKGIGILIANLAISGESFGTSLAAVDLATTMTTANSYRIAIVHDPSVPKVEWYVNGILAGSQTTAAKIASGDGGGDGYLSAYIANGATGTVNAQLSLAQPVIWQAR